MIWLLTLKSTVLSLLKLIPPRAYVVLAVVIAVCGAGLYARHRIHSLESMLNTEQFHSDSVEAVNDQTHLLLTDAEHNVVVVGRRALQVSQERDSIDRALGFTRKSLDSLKLWIKTAPKDGTATAFQIDTILSVAKAEFHERSEEGVYLDAVVKIPTRIIPNIKQPAAIRWSVFIPSVPLAVEVGCGPERPGQIRTASVLVRSPGWVTTQVIGAQQGPEVCNPGIQMPEPAKPSLTKRALIYGGVFAAGAAAAYFAERNNVKH